MMNPHELQISNALEEALKQVDDALGKIAYLRGRVQTGSREMSSLRATRVPEIARNLSIAITDLESAVLRVQNARAIFSKEAPSAG